MERVLIF